MTTCTYTFENGDVVKGVPALKAYLVEHPELVEAKAARPQAGAFYVEPSLNLVPASVRDEVRLEIERFAASAPLDNEQLYYSRHGTLQDIVMMFLRRSGMSDGESRQLKDRLLAPGMQFENVVGDSAAAQPQQSPADAQRKQAEKHARDIGGSVVWQKDDMALVRGYSILDGSPQYAATKGTKRTRVDVEGYTGDMFTAEQKAEMVKAKREAEAADAKKHAEAPFITFKDGLSFSAGVSPELAGVVTEWKRILRLGANLHVTTIDDAKANRDNFTGPHRAIGSTGLDANEAGSLRRLSNGDYYIAFSASASRVKTLETIAHELGHMHEKESYRNADPETKQAVRAEFDKWLASNKGKTARELIDSLRSYKNAREVKVGENAKADDLSAYWHSFSEWYADQTARWATSQEKPLTAVQQFFRRVGMALRRFYASASARQYLPSETFAKYMEGVTEAAKADANQQGVAMLSRASRSAPQSLAEVESSWDSQGIENALSEKDGIITLHKIIVPKGEREAGIGTRAMQELLAYADATGQQVALTPSGDFGGNKRRLESFYRGLGFRTYKGFAVREKLIRDPANPDIRYSFAGPQSQTANLYAMIEAKERLERGENAEAVRRDTGWFRGPDGRWRYEIADDEAKFFSKLGARIKAREAVEAEVGSEIKIGPDPKTPSLFKATYAEGSPDYLGAFGKTADEARANLIDQLARKRTESIFSIGEAKDGDVRSLGEVLDHPKLYAAYPDLSALPVEFVASADYRGAYYEWADRFEIVLSGDPDQMLSTLLHEVQHAIQRREGFGRGGSVDADFARAIKVAVGEMEAQARQAVENWKWANAEKISAANKAAQEARYALMWESATRLMSYANRDKPSGARRLIINEIQWIYDADFRNNDAAVELQRDFYRIPKPHKMRERNAFLSDLAYRGAQIIREHIPADLQAQFKADERPTNLLVAALRRAADRKRKDLAPIKDLEKRARTAREVKESHEYSTPFQIYRALSGEVEARNTQARQALNDEQRRNTSPYATADVPLNSVIVMFGGLEVHAPVAAFKDSPANAQRPRTPITEVRALANKIKRSYANLPKVHVFASPADLPAEAAGLRAEIARQGAENDVEGAMFDGAIYLFADNLSSLERAEFVLTEHEVAHLGLRGFFGDNLEPVLRQIAVRNPKVREAAREAQRRGKLSLTAAVEEVLADMPTAELAQLKGWRKFVQTARDWFAGKGFERIAAKLDSLLQGAISEQEAADLYVAEVVKAARDWVKGGKGETVRGAALSRNVGSGNMPNMDDADSVAGKQAPNPAGDGNTGGANAHPFLALDSAMKAKYGDGAYWKMTGPELEEWDALERDFKEKQKAEGRARQEKKGKRAQQGEWEEYLLMRGLQERSGKVYLAGTMSEVRRRDIETGFQKDQNILSAVKIPSRRLKDNKPLAKENIGAWYHGSKTPNLTAITLEKFGGNGFENMTRGAKNMLPAIYLVSDQDHASVYGDYVYKLDLRFGEALQIDAAAQLQDYAEQNGLESAQDYVDQLHEGNVYNAYDADAEFDSAIKRAKAHGKSIVVFDFGDIESRVNSDNGNHRMGKIAVVLDEGAISIREMLVNSVRRPKNEFTAPNSNGADGIRLSRATDAIKTVSDSINRDTPKNLKDWLKSQLVQHRPFAMGFLTLDQIADIYKSTIKAAKTFADVVQAMETEKQRINGEADDLAQKWRKLPGDVADKLADVMHAATLAQFDPQTFEGDAAKLDGQQRQILADWNALHKDAKAIYVEARDSHQATLKQIRDGLANQVLRASSKNVQIANQIRLDFDNYLKQGPYFPLARFGDFILISDNGKPGGRIVESFESVHERNKMKAKRIREGYKPSEIKETARKTYSSSKDGAAGAFAGEVLQRVQESDLDPEAKAKLMDEVNQLAISTLPDASYRKHFSHRKGTPGFSKDAIRAYANSQFHAAHHIAKINHADQLSFLIDEIEIEARDAKLGTDMTEAIHVAGELRKRLDSILSPKTGPIAAALGQFGFLMSLGGNIASGVTNLTQTPLVTLPWLGARYGFDKAAGALQKASKDYLGGEWNKWSGYVLEKNPKLKPDERKALETLRERGKIDLTQTHDLAGISNQTDSVTRSSQARTQAMKIVGWTFHLPEVFNRQVTALAAYRLAREKLGHEAAIEYAAQTIDRTHFNYAGSNRARHMQGDFMRVLTMFKQYSQQMTYMLWRNTQQAIAGTGATPEETRQIRREARRMLGGVMAMHFLAAGSLGLPLGVFGISTILMPIIAALAGDEDDPFDWETEFRNLLADTFGTKGGEVIAHGPLRAILPWADFAGRVGLGDLWIRPPTKEMEGRDALEAWTQTLAGPTFGYLGNMATAGKLMSEGEFLRGIEAASPKMISGPLKALRFGTEGVKTMKGDDTGIELDALDIGFTALGWSPSDVAEAFEARTAIKNREHLIDLRKQRLMNRWYQARKAGDFDEVSSVMEEIDTFNSVHEGDAWAQITPKKLMQSAKAKERNAAQIKEGVYLSKNRESLRDIGRFADVGNDTQE